MKNEFYNPNFSLGILGGGQLGRMFIQEAINYNLNVAFLDPAVDAPCAKLTPDFTQGDLKDYETVLNFGKQHDVITIEIEHVNAEALKALEEMGKKVYPQSKPLSIIQDKGLQKEFFAKIGVPTAPFQLIENKAAFIENGVQLPIVQKLRKGGYDGKGVAVIKNQDDFANAFDAPSVLEELADIDKEIAVIVARNPSGETAVYPTVELEFNHEANLVDLLFSPAKISEGQETEAQDIALKIATELNIVGLLAVELFVNKDGSIWVNEVAPRPHNSGHHTIEANVTSQYEQHMRSILDLPLGDTSLIKNAAMVNLLGEKNYTGDAYYKNIDQVMSMPETHIHLYGKSTTKPMRKMGHITVTNHELDLAINNAKKAKSLLQVISK